MMQRYCQHTYEPTCVCGYCWRVLYCGQKCADENWSDGHALECIAAKRKRKEEKIVPEQWQLDMWTDENPSGWDRGTVPRRWPENWIYNDDYFSNYWDKEDEEQEEESLISLDPMEEEEEKENEEEEFDSDDVPSTVKLPKATSASQPTTRGKPSKAQRSLWFSQ